MPSELRFRQSLVRCMPDLRLRKQQGKLLKLNSNLRRLQELKLNSKLKIKALLMM